MNTNFENKHKYCDIYFRYAKGKSLRQGNEIHPYHEILYFIKGGGRFFTEQFDTELQEHMLFLIPQNTYHQFSVKDEDKYTRLTVAFEDRKEWSDISMFSSARVNIIKELDPSVQFLLTKMCTALTVNDNTAQSDRILYGAFLMLLSEIAETKREALPAEHNRDRTLISKCTAYIDANFSSNISVDDLAVIMNTSSATLFWHFKKYLGISIHKYILQKRMAYAHILLSQGSSPTKIYHECGYHDYATFYKMYCKHFGYPPSKTPLLTNNL